MVFDAYLPPVNTNDEVAKTQTDHNEIKTSQDVYEITAKDVKKNLSTLNKKVNDKYDGPDNLDQVEVSGPDQIVLNTVETYTDVAGAMVESSNVNSVKIATSPNGPWVTVIFVPSDGIFYAKGVGVGTATIITNSGQPNKDVEVVNTQPISLKSYNVELQDGKYPHLSWTTAMESDNDHFEIERSINGGDWIKIDTVKSKAKEGNSRKELNYEYTDKTKGLYGVVLYRITQVDKSGQTKTYPAESVIIEKQDNVPVLSPNPLVQGETAHLDIFDENQNEYRIVNKTGQVVASGNLVKGKNYLNTAHLTPGTYFIQIPGGKTVKLVVR